MIDPEVEVRPTHHQIDNLLNEIRLRAAAGERVLVTTLTKRMAEDPIEEEQEEHRHEEPADREHRESHGVKHVSAQHRRSVGQCQGG